MKKNKGVTVSGSGLSVKWDVAVPHSQLTLTISAPDGQVFRKEFKVALPNLHLPIRKAKGFRTVNTPMNFASRLRSLQTLEKRSPRRALKVMTRKCGAISLSVVHWQLSRSSFQEASRS